MTIHYEKSGGAGKFQLGNRVRLKGADPTDPGNEMRIKNFMKKGGEDGADCEYVVSSDDGSHGLSKPVVVEMAKSWFPLSELEHVNVFTDLGFPHSEQELVKAKLTVQIYRLLKDRGLTQTEAAKLLGSTQPQVSALMRCRPVSVSVGRLIEFLTILGQDVEVTVKPSTQRNKGQQGHMSVTVQ